MIPAKMLPFASANSNHSYLLSVRSNDYGCVYVYNPELDGEISMRRVAASFSEFCQLLKRVPEE
jgi:hypothetical protein